VVEVVGAEAAAVEVGATAAAEVAVDLRLRAVAEATEVASAAVIWAAAGVVAI